jgi:tRNA(Ile)-lysidine synthase
MDPLGPFEPNPALAVAVSGGADSMALAVLARDWAAACGGSAFALVVDHGLRATSAAEAHLTAARLAENAIPARVLTLSGLRPGSALAERARIMRYRVLFDACAQAGALHLLLGHHAADQQETLAMRVLRRSGTHGLAAMSALRETPFVRLLRPLLNIDPARLRRFLTERGVAWVEDPSNQDRNALRPRLRFGFGYRLHDETGRALASAGHLRRREEAAAAEELAERVTIRPEGFAVLSPGRVGAGALGSLLRTIGGGPYPPAHAQITELAAEPRPATVAGVRLLPAGRLGPGLLLMREEAAIGEAVPAQPGAIWDRRFRLVATHPLPPGTVIGKLGPDAARLRGRSDLPSAVLRTLPAIRIGGALVSVPNIGYACQENDLGMTLLFSPQKPAAGPCFVPAT